MRFRGGETSWLDRQVSALACVRIPTFYSGRITSEQRQLSLWIDGGPVPTRMTATNQLAPGAPDPLQPLVDRLSQRLLEQGQDALRRHIPVSGERWHWDGQFLDYEGEGGRPGRVSIDEISSLESLSGRLRIWKSNEPLPFFTVPLKLRNAWLLRELLDAALTERGGRVPTTEMKNGLGRLLFERHPTRLFGWLIGGVGVAMLAVAAILITSGAIRGRWPASLIGIALIPAAGLVMLAGRRLARSVLRCYELGLRKNGFSGTTELRFDEVDVFSFDARRQYSHGKYTGTAVTLILATHARPSAGIFHTETVPHINDELEELCERVAEHIARRMARAYAIRRLVQWTPELWFEETGLRYTRQSFWRRHAPRLIPYDSILEYEVDQEWLHIWTNDQERAAVKVRTSAPNFHPGLIVLEGLIGPMETEAHHAGPVAIPDEHLRDIKPHTGWRGRVGGGSRRTLRPYEMFRERQCRMTRRIANQAATPSRMFPIHIDQSGSMFPRFACAIRPTISG